MNKIMMAGIAVLVLVIGIGSNAIVHSADAKGMPHHWLNSDGTVKAKYQNTLNGDYTGLKFTQPTKPSKHK